MLDQGITLADVVRKWYPTICYELCLGNAAPRVKIRYDPPVNSVGSIGFGNYDARAHLITMYALPATPRSRGRYLFTLAHEARHAWQVVYRQPPTEADCDDFAERFLARHRDTGPVLGRFAGHIDGEPFMCQCGRPTINLPLPCADCRDRERKRKEVEACRAEAERARRVQEAEYDRVLAGWEEERRAAKEREAWRRKLDEIARRGGSRAERLRVIDNHPDNGCEGWWRVGDSIWVYASSAGEALVKAASRVGNEVPVVRYIGHEPPPEIRLVTRKGAGRR